MKFYDPAFYDMILYSAPEKDGQLYIDEYFKDILALQEDAMNDIRKKLFPNKITKANKIRKTVKTAIKKVFNAKKLNNYFYGSMIGNSGRLDWTTLDQNLRWRINYWLVKRAPLAAAFVQSHPNMWLYFCAEEKCIMNKMCNYLYNHGVTWIGKVHDAIEMKKSDAEKWAPYINNLFIECLGYIDKVNIAGWFEKHGHPEYYSTVDDIGLTESEMKYYVPSTEEFLKTFNEDIKNTAKKYYEFKEKEYREIYLPNESIFTKAEIQYETEKIDNFRKECEKYNNNPDIEYKLWLDETQLQTFNLTPIDVSTNSKPSISDFESNGKGLTNVYKHCIKNETRLQKFKKKVDNEFASNYYRTHQDDPIVQQRKYLKDRIRNDFYELFYSDTKEKGIPKEFVPLF